MAARTLLAATSVSRTAFTAFPTPTVSADAVNGNVTVNDGATWLAVFNTDATTHNLTVQLDRGIDSLTTGPRAYVVPVTSAGIQLAGPFPLHFYGTQLLWNADSANVKVAAYSTLGP